MRQNRRKRKGRISNRYKEEMTDWQTDWLTECPTDRQTDWMTDRQTDRLTDWMNELMNDRQTDWQIDRQTERQTDWLTDRQTDRLTDWMNEWMNDRQTDWQIDLQRDRLTDWLTERLTDWMNDWPTDRPTDWLTDWQTNRLTERQTDRLTDWKSDWLRSLFRPSHRIGWENDPQTVVTMDPSPKTILPPFLLIREFGKQNTRGNVSKISVSLACVLLTDRIEIHQLQPLVWSSNLLYVMLSGCDWWISIRSVKNTHARLTEILETFLRVFCFPKSRINENGCKLRVNKIQWN